MKTDFSSSNLVVCLAGAIILATLSYRADSLVVTVGLGLAYVFLLMAAFRAYGWKSSQSSRESRGEK